MTNKWISHVKEYQAKNKCSYKDAMIKSKKTYKSKSGGKLGGDVTRGLVWGIRKGMKLVPLGDTVMKGVNPVLDEGLSQVSDWEKGVRPIDRMTQKQKDAAYRKYKKGKGKKKKKKK